MLLLRTFGRIELTTSGGSPIRALIVQPKRTALFIYLAAVPPGEYVRRSTLLTLFWPESDEFAARHSLSQALYKLRLHVGRDLIELRGEEELRLAPHALASDLASFRSAVESAQWSEALRLMNGEFLAGLELAGSDGFDRWVEVERERLRRSAAMAAWTLATEQTRDGAVDEADRSARRAIELDPVNEAAVRRQMKAFAAHGAVTAAVDLFYAFRERLRSELEMDPSVETVALVRSIREAPTTLATAPTLALPFAQLEPISLSPPPAPAAVGASVSDVPGTVPAQDRSKRRRHLSLVIAAGVMLAAMTTRALLSRPALPTDIVRSVAVFPLADRTDDYPLNYLAAGLHNALAGELTQVTGLRVIPLATLLQLDTTRAARRRMARELGVDLLVEGSVYRTEDRVRVLIELVRTRSESSIWTGSYERRFDNLMSLERDLAEAIGSELQVRIGSRRDERSPPTDVAPAAYDAWLKGSYHASRRRGEDLRLCVRYGQEAVAISQEFADAHVLLAQCRNMLAFVDTVAPGVTFAMAQASARRAIVLDPRLASAHAALAYSLAHYNWDWNSAERAYQQALALDPMHAGAHGDLAWLLSWQGRTDEALLHARRAEALDPLSPHATLRIGMILHLARRHDEAVAHASRAIQLDSTFMFAFDRLHWAYYGMGRHDDAERAARRAASLGGPDDVRRRAFLAHALALVGRRDEAIVILDELRTLERQRYIPPLAIAAVYVGLGDTASALTWLERGFKERDGGMVLLHAFPLWDPLRKSPRYSALVHRMRLD